MPGIPKAERNHLLDCSNDDFHRLYLTVVTQIAAGKTINNAEKAISHLAFICVLLLLE
jgi:hypothetical protein